jgi:hypothetical protein
MKIGHGSNSGIQGFRNLGIEGILSILKLSNDGAQRLPQLVISHFSFQTIYVAPASSDSQAVTLLTLAA